jgi:hypothetical protein
LSMLFECKLWHLRQELLGFERHWIYAARALNASSVGSQIPRGQRAIRKLCLWISTEKR